MTSRIKIIVILTIVLGALLLLYIGRGTSERANAAVPSSRPVPVRCIKLVRRSHAVTESFYGFIEPSKRVELAFEIAGRIARLGSTEHSGLIKGARVAPGDVLASLDPTRYVAAVAEAHARMERAEAERDAARSLVDHAQVSLKDDSEEHARMQQIFDRSAASRRELHKSELSVTIARIQLDHATSQLTAASAAHDAAVAAMTLAEANRRDTVLRATIPGRVSEVHIEVGEMIASSEPVIIVIDISTVKLVIGVAERKLPLLREGQHASVKVEAFSTGSLLVEDGSFVPGPLQGRVTLVPPAADSVTGLFNIEIELPNTQDLLRPGMIGKATVIIAEKMAVAIPAEAVVDTGHSAWVFCVDDPFRAGLSSDREMPSDSQYSLHARRVMIKPSLIRGDWYLVDDFPRGFKQLVIEGQTRLVDGQRVSVLDGDITPTEVSRLVSETQVNK